MQIMRKTLCYIKKSVLTLGSLFMISSPCFGWVNEIALVSNDENSVPYVFYTALENLARSNKYPNFIKEETIGGVAKITLTADNQDIVCLHPGSQYQYDCTVPKELLRLRRLDMTPISAPMLLWEAFNDLKQSGQPLENPIKETDEDYSNKISLVLEDKSRILRCSQNSRRDLTEPTPPPGYWEKITEALNNNDIDKLDELDRELEAYYKDYDSQPKELRPSSYECYYSHKTQS